MKVKIEKKEAFNLAGIKYTNIDSSQCVKAWDELFEKYDIETLVSLGSGISYGACFDMEVEGKINYLAGFDTNDINKAKSIGLDILQVEEAEYAIIPLKGPVPKCIHDGWKYAMEIFLPEEGYRHSGRPDFEVYYDGDMDSEDYKMELWIPIEK